MPPLIILGALAIATIPTGSLLAPARALGPKPISIGNSHFRLEFKPAPNSMAFTRLLKLSGGAHSFVNDTPSGRLWEVALRQLPIPQGPGVFPVVVKVHPTDCVGPVTHDTVRSGSSTTLTITWNDCRPVPADPTNQFNLRLRITVTAGSPVSEWNLEVENRMPGWALYYVSLVHGFAQEAQDTYLVVPVTGRLVRNPQTSLAANPTGFGPYGVPFTNWQHFQLYPYYTADGHGVYYATHDGLATHAKFTNLFGYGNRYEIQTAYYPEDSSVSTIGTTYQTPYPIVMGVFDGDWYDAAQIYRSWAQTQPILEKGKLLTRTDVPLWAKELTLTNLGYLPQPLTDPAAVNAYVAKWVDIKNTQGLAADDYFVLQWHWITPDSLGFYQPLPGIDGLFLALRNQDIYSGVRKLSFTYAQSAPPSPCGNPQPESATLVNGTPDPFDPGGGTHVNPFMPFALCYMNDFVQNRLLPTHAVHFFYDNPYFTDVSYDTAHGNPLGQGGSWLYDRVVQVMQDVRIAARAIEPRFVNTHEAAFEAYIRACDASGSGYNLTPPWFVNPASAADEIRIPLQPTLYHDYSLLLTANEMADYLGFFNAYSNLADIDFVLAHGFNEGRRLNTIEPLLQFGYANHEVLNPGSPLLAASPALAQTIFDHTLFLKKVVAVKKATYGRKYLTYGQLRRPLDLPTLGPVTKTFHPLPPGSGPPYPITASEVLSSVWKASDGTGDVGVVFTNYNPYPVSFTLVFDPDEYDLDPAAPHDLTHLEPTSSTFVQQFTGVLTLPITIPPRTVRVYEID